LLPDGLEVALTLVLPHNGGYGREFGWSNVHRFGEHSTDGSYTGVTIQFAERLVRIESAADGDTLALRITPEKLLCNEYLGVEVAGLWGRNAVVKASREKVTARCGERTHTVLASHRSEQLAFDPSTAQRMNLPLTVGPVYVAVNRPADPAEIDTDIERNRRRWLDSRIAADGPLGEGLDALCRVLLWNTVYEPVSRRIITPVSRQWCQNQDGSFFGYYVLFGWDTFFAALMFGLVDKELAYAAMSSILEEIVPEGHIPNCGSACGSTNDRSEPQVGAWCAMKLYRQFGDRELLEECFDRLLRWNRWRFAERDRNGDGLLELGSDPYTPEWPDQHWHKIKVNEKQGAMWESGLDNHPMWDDAVYNTEKHCLELSYAGENGLMVADCQALADMAAVLGRKSEETELRERADRLGRLVNSELWSEEAGTYLNRDWSGRFSPVLGLPHFYPMIAGIVSDKRRARLLRRLTDPAEFGGNLVIPNVSRKEPTFSNQEYWRGRIWAPTNFLVSEGLRRSGEPEIARDIARKSLDILVRNWREKGVVSENYNAVTGEGSERNGSDRFYTWGALMTYLAVQEYIDPLAWRDEVRFGPGVPDCGKLRNVPYRDKRLTLPA
jgi:glycogen debranching enzyme